MSIITQNAALQGLLAAHLPALAEYEGLTPEAITSAIEAGTMVLLGNPNHANVKPILVGQPSRVKVNANIGTSPFQNHPGCEMRKLEVAQESGADTVMDLSIAGDLVAIRKDMLSRTPLPLGTVPLYSVAQRYIDKDRDPADIDPEELFAEVEMQAEQGVDFMTLHCGLTRRGAEWAARGERALGIVSRGGSILARWMLKNDKENPLLTGYDRLLELARKYNVTLSLGDGLRPGAGCDAGDAAQWEEVMTLGALAKRGLEYGVQCMIEGPGHVPMNEVEAQIISIKKMTHGAPLYVLGPLTIDSSPGYDHIAGAIGGAMLGVRKPPIIRNVVVFPHPLGPSNVRNSLLLMYRLIPSRTVTPSSNVMERFDKRMSFSDIYHPPFHFNISAELPDFSARPACIFPTIRQKNPRESDRIPCGFSLSRKKDAAVRRGWSGLPFGWVSSE